MGSCTATVCITIILNVFSPGTSEELFNLQHAKAQNVFERSFGVIKQQFKILIILPEYSRNVQAQLVPMLAGNRVYDMSRERGSQCET